MRPGKSEAKGNNRYVDFNIPNCGDFLYQLIKLVATATLQDP
jgi:hypothetical protein